MTQNALTEDPTAISEPERARARTPRRSLVALRIIAIAHLLVFFLQPVLAGIYLAGDFDALGLHDLNAQILSGFTAAQLIGCLIYAWRGGGRWWPLIFTVVLVLLEESQKGLGYNRLISLDVPIGVLLIITQLIFTYWTFTGSEGGVDHDLEHDGHAIDLVLPAGADDPHRFGHHMVGTVTTGHRDYVYPHDQRAATLWYHDHRMDFTAPQIYRGLAGFQLVRDDEEAALPLPDGDRDIPLMIMDRAFAEDGSFKYPSLDPSLTAQRGVQPDYMEGVLGDTILVNGAPWPSLEVDAARYRFRILNASNARRYRLALESSTGARCRSSRSDPTAVCWHDRRPMK